MQPGAAARAAAADRLQVVARAGVHVARLRAHDGRAGRPAPSAAARASGSIAPAGVAGTSLERAFAQPEQPKRAVDRRVPLRAGQDPHTRRAMQAVAPDVPAAPLQHLQRPAASPTVFAPWPPVTKPTDAEAGSAAAP